jgi:hypothetical protein
MSKIQIDVEKSVTSRLGFEPIKAYYGFCLGYLTGVRLEKSVSEADAKWEFAGYETSRLVFDFAQLQDEHNDKERSFSYSVMPISNTNADGKEKTDKTKVLFYTEVWNHVKHIHDQFIGSPNYKPLTAVPDFDYELDINARLAQFEKFFTDAFACFTVGKDEKTPIFEPYGGKTKDNLLVMKLVASGDKNAYLSFPNFVGKGFVEKAVFKNSVLDTVLKFGVSETSVTGNANIQRREPSAVQQGISDEVKKLLGQA